MHGLLFTPGTFVLVSYGDVLRRAENQELAGKVAAVQSLWVYGDAARTWVRRERESGCLTCPPEKIRGCVALSNVGYSICFRVAGGLAVERGICAVGVASVAARCGIRRYVGLFQSRSARLSQRVYAYGAEPVRARDG